MAQNFCPFCGTALLPDTIACPHCGRMTNLQEQDGQVSSGVPDPPAPEAWHAAAEQPQAPEPETERRRPAYWQPGNTRPQPVESPESIGTSTYLGMLIVSGIPVLGLVLLLIWAFDSPGRPNRRSFARALLILRLIVWIVALVLVFGISMWFFMMNSMFHY